MTSLHLTQLFFALLEGIGLILSPCILPILPIMLAASLDGGRKRPLGIITGFVGAFTAFALLSRQLLSALHADPTIVRNVALVMLMAFGIIMLSKKLSDKLLGATQGLANFGNDLTSRWNQKEGYLSGVAIGAMIGLIWTPCAGPIMAAAIVQIIQAKSSLEATLTVVMFALGASIPMLAIALTGRKIMSRLSFLKTHSYTVRRVMGIVIIAAAVLIYEGADVQLLASSGGTPMPTVATTQIAGEIPADGKLHKALDNPYPAPEIAGIKDWINSTPLTIASLRGKAVLIDFWTYSCINCVRTLPYITAWDAKYRDKGLVIIGVHSPEFEFEKKLDNVQAATVKYGIHYPVALDSDLATWSAFKNQYWPAHYLIDQKGQVVYTHFGEGDYDTTENNIRVLLGLGPEKAETPITTDQAAHADSGQTQETYLGFSRAKNFVGKRDGNDKTLEYAFPDNLPVNNWALSGAWQVGAENITSEKPDTGLRLNFTAKKVFLVLGAGSKPAHLRVMLNGKPVTTEAGADVKDGIVTVDRDALYELINQDESKNGLLELSVDSAGLRAFAFTFGG